MNTVVDINNLSKTLGNLPAIDNLTFSHAKREKIALIGPNGSGKTTLVKLITGLLRPAAGTIKIQGIDVAVDPVRTKSLLGYVPDEPSVWNHLTGEEFLHLVGSLYGIDQDKRKSRIENLLAIYDLRGVEKGYFQNYSRGNKQKFAVLAALLHEPKLLVIDEPIVGLDPESISATKKLLTEFAKDGGTVLMVTHLLQIAQDIATTIGVLKLGKLIEFGSLSKLREKAHLSANVPLEEVYLRLTQNT